MATYYSDYFADGVESSLPDIPAKLVDPGRGGGVLRLITAQFQLSDGVQYVDLGDGLGDFVHLFPLPSGARPHELYINCDTVVTAHVFGDIGIYGGPTGPNPFARLPGNCQRAFAGNIAIANATLEQENVVQLTEDSAQRTVLRAQPLWKWVNSGAGSTVYETDPRIQFTISFSKQTNLTMSEDSITTVTMLYTLD